MGVGPAHRVAANCANFRPYPPSFSKTRGQCFVCGVQWQDAEVGCLYRCPQFTPTTKPRSAE